MECLEIWTKMYWSLKEVKNNQKIKQNKLNRIFDYKTTKRTFGWLLKYMTEYWQLSKIMQE